MDLILRKAKLEKKAGLWDIGIKAGKFAQIAPEIKEKAPNEIEAGGKLFLPTFVEPHTHLDKCLISESVRENKSGTLMEAIEIIREKKRNYTIDDIVSRAGRAIEMYAQNGVTHLRTHVDVDPIGGLKPLEGLLAARQKYNSLVEIQIVAFPQEGILKAPGTRELMREALKMGADVVGGMPFNELDPVDGRAHIDFCFELAKEFSLPIDMHIDETDTPEAKTLEYLAAKTLKENYQEKVTACHCCALAAYDDYYAEKVIDQVAEAKLNIITNPATNLMLQGRLDRYPKRRGLTRVRELLERGVNVSFGQDCIKDTFYPTLGSADPLEVGLILAHAVQFTLPQEIELIFKMATDNAAKVYGLSDFGILEGSFACGNLIDAPDVVEAFRTRADRLYVLRAGKVIARNRSVRELFF